MGQLLLMLLTMILAGMLLSNLIEEKSNKVIEVLAAAVPVDAIFIGKLMAMLAMSLTGIAVWGGAAALAVGLLAPQARRRVARRRRSAGRRSSALGVVYFVLLLPAARRAVPRHRRAGLDGARGADAVDAGDDGADGRRRARLHRGRRRRTAALAMAAMAFPWSSPFAMLARAAQIAGLWPHAAGDRLAGAVGRADHPRRGRPLPPLGAQSGGPRRRFFARRR